MIMWLESFSPYLAVNRRFESIISETAAKLCSNVFRFLDEVNVEACKALHIGDDEKADKLGANNVGIDCW